jgi:hypothetical protein
MGEENSVKLLLIYCHRPKAAADLLAGSTTDELMPCSAFVDICSRDYFHFDK